MRAHVTHGGLRTQAHYQPTFRSGAFSERSAVTRMSLRYVFWRPPLSFLLDCLYLFEHLNFPSDARFSSHILPPVCGGCKRPSRATFGQSIRQPVGPPDRRPTSDPCPKCLHRRSGRRGTLPAMRSRAWGGGRGGRRAEHSD